MRFSRFALLVLLSGVASAQSGASLFPGPIHPVGQPDEYTWMEVLLGDVTGDGLLDAVLATHDILGSGDGEITVCAGDAGGGFGGPVGYPMGCCGEELPYGYALADLDGDGRLDVVASTNASGGGYAIGVLRGNAQGTFDAAVYYPTTVYGYSGSIAVGDITGDGRRDVVLRGYFSSSICILAGNAQGGLDPEVCTAVAGLTGLLRVGDVTGDGRLDVVTTGGGPGEVCVLAGNAQGTLDGPVCFAAGAGNDGTAGLELADTNRDGRLDIVVAESDSGICVCAGNAQGTFDSPVCQNPGGDQTAGLTVGDVNGDAFPDVIARFGGGALFGGGELSLLRGKSSGTFDAPVRYAPRGYTSPMVAIGDLGNDGRPDVVLANGGTVDLCTLHWDGQSGLDAPDAYPTTGYARPALADITGDGRTDVVVVSGTGTGQVCVLAGNAAHRLDAQVCYDPGGASPNAIAVGDVTGDGRPDVVCDTSSGITVLAGNAQGTLDPPALYPAADGVPAVGDITGDGRKDVVVSTASGVCVLAANPQGTLDAPQCTPAARGWIELGDVTGDGRLDAVVVAWGAQGQVDVLAGNAQGTLDPPVSYPSVGNASGVALGDATGDGRTDVVVAGYSHFGILAGNAQGTLDPLPPEPTGRVLRGIALADVGGEGRPDLVTTESIYFSNCECSATLVVVREQDPQGGFEPERLYAEGGMDRTIIVGDVTGDGRADVLGESYGALVVLENEAPPLGTRACFGTGCPCANDGTGDRGCQNSTGTGGAQLNGEGAASLANDTAKLLASGELASVLTLFVQGNATIPAQAYGDGLRCAGGALKRLFARSASAGAVAVPGPGDLTISARSAAKGDPLSAGAVRVYQAYYRDSNPSFCPGPTGANFNVTSSLTITWAP